MSDWRSTLPFLGVSLLLHLLLLALSPLFAPADVAEVGDRFGQERNEALFWLIEAERPNGEAVEYADASTATGPMTSPRIPVSATSVGMPNQRPAMLPSPLPSNRRSARTAGLQIGPPAGIAPPSPVSPFAPPVPDGAPPDPLGTPPEALPAIARSSEPTADGAGSANKLFEYVAESSAPSLGEHRPESVSLAELATGQIDSESKRPTLPPSTGLSLVASPIVADELPGLHVSGLEVEKLALMPSEPAALRVPVALQRPSEIMDAGQRSSNPAPVSNEDGVAPPSPLPPGQLSDHMAADRERSPEVDARDEAPPFEPSVRQARWETQLTRDQGTTTINDRVVGRGVDGGSDIDAGYSHLSDSENVDGFPGARIIENAEMIATEPLTNPEMLQVQPLSSMIQAHDETGPAGKDREVGFRPQGEESPMDGLGRTLGGGGRYHHAKRGEASAGRHQVQEAVEPEVIVSPVFVPPRIKSKVAPSYPSRARRQGAEGSVILEVDVSENGLPTGVKLLKSSGRKDLDAAALEAVKKWQFYPAQKDERPASGRVEIVVRFQLSD